MTLNYNLALRHTFSVQLPSVRRSSSKAVVSRKSMCADGLTVRSIIQKPKGKQCGNREASRVQVNKITKQPLFDFCIDQIAFSSV